MLNTADPQWFFTPCAGLQINSTALSNDGTQLITGTSSEYGSSNDFAIYSYQTNGSTYTENWSDSLGSNITQGVFWVAMAGNGTQCAAGGEYGSGKGFLRTYNVSQGIASRQEFDTSGRINEVEINTYGSQIVAVEEGNIHYLSLNAGSYSDSVTSISSVYLRSCDISDDGTWVVVGGESDSSASARTLGRQTSETQASTGLFYLYQGVNGQLIQRGSFTATSGILRVALSHDGQYAAASTKSGEVLFFNFVRAYSAQLTPEWTYTATDVSIGMSYALSICHTSGMVYVGVGGNHAGTSAEGDGSTTPPFGYSYMLQSTFDCSTNQYYGNRLWIYPLQYCPNPGMNMDANANYVTSADGEPIFSSSKTSAGTTSETPGNFYLFDVKNGTLYWQYPTSLMNWPMAINSDGTAIFAGSDNGNVYYWGNPSISKK